MSIITRIVPVDDEGELYDPWQQIFITRPLSDGEISYLKTIDPQLGEDGNSDDDCWLNISFDPRVKEYLETLS